MQQAYDVGNVSVIPVEGLTRGAVFEGITLPDTLYRYWPNEVVPEAHTKIIQRLREWIPEYIDETVQLGDGLAPNVFACTSYVIPLPHGIVKATISIQDDLAGYLLKDGLTIDYSDEEQREEVVSLFHEKSGVVIRP